MKEEDKIAKKLGTENHFSVPEGYFENLTSEVMNRLPEKEKQDIAHREPTRWERVRPWLYMAAMFVGAALIIRIGASSKAPEAAAMADRVIGEETETEMEYINNAIDHSMMDDYSLYVYLADTNGE